MTSDDMKVAIDGKLNIVEPSTNELVRELVPTHAIDGPSEEIMTSDHIKVTIDSNLDIVESFTPSYVPTNELVGELIPLIGGPSEETNYLDNEMQRLVDERQRLVDEMQRRVDEMQRLIAGEERWSIPKVPYRLREVKQKAYEPNAISIGPYHYGKEHLRTMDVVKRSSFANIVKETKLELNEFVESMKPLKERALNCYERPIHADLEPDDKFIEMMVYDGCFIVQLIRNMYPPELAKLPRHIQNDMWDDLLLVENQLPFFVLLELDRIIMGNDGGGHVKFQNAALSSFFELDAYALKIFSEGISELTSPDDIKHILDMVHKCCHPSSRGIMKHKKYSRTKEAKGSIRSGKFMLSASELDNSGIDFVGVEGKSLYDVTFGKYTNVLRLKIGKKVLKIPTLYVHKNTERRLRNLMAYEQFASFGKPTYVSDYVVLMDNLVKTGKDVRLLRAGGVIENRLADDEAVAQMFNELGDSTCSKEDFYYAEIVGKVNRHCKGNVQLAKWNKYIANLKRDYFSSPWSVCSFLAAVILLVATVLQTAYTLISYYHADDGGRGLR